MYLDFIYVILDYFSTLTKKEKWFEWGIPIFLSVVGGIICVSFNLLIQYDIIKEIITFLGVLLGFTLASLTLLLSNDKVRTSTQQYPTQRKIRGKAISLYTLIPQYKFL